MPRWEKSGKETPAEHVRALEQMRVAFGPKTASVARKMNTKIGADDDGAAIFWRSEKLRLVGGPSFLSLPSYIPKTAVRVELARVSDGARLNVVCAHLASGDKGSHEAARLNEVGVLMPWLGASIAAAPTIFCECVEGL